MKKSTMTGYERTMAAISREPADRPPFDFWAEDATLNRLFAFLGHSDLDLFLDGCDVDIRGLDAVQPAPVYLGSGVYQNMWGERFVYQETPWGPMREDTYGALYYAQSFDELKEFPWPSNDVMDYGGLFERCKKIKEKKLAIRYGFADIWQRPSLVRGLENHLADMINNPGWVHFLSRVFTDFYLEEYRRAWEVSKGMIDIFTVISDVGTQRGPLISIGMFDEFIAPYIREIADMVHDLGAKIMYHSCGDVSAFIPSIIASGIDILNPVQPVSASMRPEALKKYPVCFHGGIDIQWLLPGGTPEQIKNEIRNYSEVFGRGYIACPAHLFQPATPPENIAAFYDAFRDW